MLLNASKMQVLSAGKPWKGGRILGAAGVGVRNLGAAVSWRAKVVKIVMKND
jgi:hypothetical protein